MLCNRAVSCKVEEVSSTIRRHLEKEDQQLVPLLAKHFNYTEQALMIAQILFCIPMMAVQSFLNWTITHQEERTRLMQHMRQGVSDELLMSLLTAWLSPADQPDRKRSHMVEAVMWSGEDRAPLEQITNVHRSIDASLDGFIREARGLLEEEIGGERLESLLEQHRFLKDVCRFHMLSEEEIMFPELLKQSHTCQALYVACHMEHLEEGIWFDNLGRLLTEVRSNARRGCKEAKKLLEQVVVSAEAMRENLGLHMTREETEVFPILQEKLGSGEQCLIVWQTLQMMPLRLLERVMPWISSLECLVGSCDGWVSRSVVGE